MNVIEFKGGNPRIGLVGRNGTTGPEAELVKVFKSLILNCFRWKKGDLAIFQEPQMETGFPDLVAVQYNPESYTEWAQARSELKQMDLKLMHHLLHSRGARSEALSRNLGIGSKALLLSLERLVNANMITRSRGKWMPRSLKAVFGVWAIVAVEAKIKNWSDAFQQGQLNQWFASESYVLSPIETPQGTVLEQSLQTGVGILLLNGMRVRRLHGARKSRIPASYGSWIFNEWIGRHLQGG